MRRRMKVVTVFGTTLLLMIIVALWAARRADAIIIVNSNRVDTGYFGIIGTETVVTHVANVSEREIAPCIVEVSFFDNLGAVLLKTSYKVPPGKVGSAEFKDPSLGQGARRLLRVVVAQNPQPDFESIAQCLTTTEKIDSRTQAGIIVIGSHPVR